MDPGMEKETGFYTATMAQVYADQGYWDKAAAIYRHLLAQEPEREEYLAALANAEKRAKQDNKQAVADLAPVFQQWFDLMLRYKNLQKLRKLKS